MVRKRDAKRYERDYVSHARIKERRTMTTNVQSGSAKIYQFPARGRFIAGALREDSKSALVPALSPRIARTASGSGWYHEEAILEAERTREQ
jgi:hypothetical protein